MAAATKLTNATYLDTDWSLEITSKNETKRGHFLAKIDISGATPVVKAGTCVDVDGTLYLFESDENASGSPSDGDVYLYVYDSSGTGLAALTNTPPVWDELQKGWYNAVSGTQRYIARMYLDTGVYSNLFYMRKITGENVEIQEKLVTSCETTDSDSKARGRYVKEIVRISLTTSMTEDAAFHAFEPYVPTIGDIRPTLSISLPRAGNDYGIVSVAIERISDTEIKLQAVKEGRHSTSTNADYTFTDGSSFTLGSSSYFDLDYDGTVVLI